MLRNTLKTFYVDHVGYEVKYNLGDKEMTELDSGELYHFFNGFYLLGVF